MTHKNDDFNNAGSGFEKEKQAMAAEILGRDTAGSGEHQGGGGSAVAQNGALKYLLMSFVVLMGLLVLLGLSFRVVMIPQVTIFLADRYADTTHSAMEREQLVDVAERGRDFVDCVPGASMPEGTDESISFTPDVVSHMEDVRSVIRIASYITFAACIFLLLASVLCWRTFGRKALGTALMVGAVLILVIVAVLVAIGAFNFNSLFNAMHEILFADGTWTFSIDSLLINTYPSEFWIGMAIVWAVSLLVLSAIMIVVAWLLRHKTKALS